MGDLVAQMAEQRAERFMQIHPAALALLVIRFRNVHGDGPAAMAGEGRLPKDGVAQKAEAQRRPVFIRHARHGQAQAQEGVHHAALGRLQFAPALPVAPDGEIGNHIV